MPSLVTAWLTMPVASEVCNLPERILNVKGNMGRLREDLKGQQDPAREYVSASRVSRDLLKSSKIGF